MEKGRVVEDAAGPAEELIELEDGADLEMPVGELSGSLSVRQRDVFALWFVHPETVPMVAPGWATKRRASTT